MCCLFGVVDYHNRLSVKQKNRILSVLAAASEARGTDATGIAYNSDGRLCVYKRPLPGRWMRFKVPADASVVMGHTRMATQGDAKKNRNNHPFSGHTDAGEFALAHNGVLFNDRELRRERKLPATKIETDSYIAVQLLEQRRKLDVDNLRSMAEQVRGSFVFTVLDQKNALHIVRGDNPFCMYHFPNRGLYLYASTEAILFTALDRLHLSPEEGTEVSVRCGDILQIHADGSTQRDRFDDTSLLIDWHPAWQSYWYHDYESNRFKSTEKKDKHLEELRSVAMAFGYAPEDVDMLASQGFTAEEIEEFFYCGEL